MFIRMFGAKGKAQPRRAGRHRRRPDGDDEEAFVLEHVRSPDCGFRSAEQQRHNRALCFGQAEATSEIARLGERSLGQAGIGCDNVERGDRGGGIGRRQAGRIDQRACARLHQIDDRPRGAEIAAVRAERLRQSAHLQGHIGLAGIERRRTAALRQHAEPVRVVGHEPCVGLGAEQGELGNRSQIAVHRKDAVGDKQRVPRATAFSGENGARFFDVVVTEDAAFRRRQTRAGEKAGMRELIDENEIAVADERRNDAEIGEVAGAEDASRLGGLQLCKPRFEFGKERMIAGDEAGGAGAGAKSAERGNRRLFDFRMARETEIIIAGEGDEPASAADDDRAILGVRGTAGRNQAAPQRGFLQLRKLAARECVESVQGPTFIWLLRGVAVALRSGNKVRVEIMGEADWQEAWREHIWLPYSQMKTAAPPLPVVATEGTRIRLADGRELVDGIASWWTACHGYNHPHIRHAVARQLKAMPHVMFGGLVHEPAVRLATRLAALLPGDLERVFFSDSGSVAVEVALKMAAQFWLNQGVAGRSKFLAFKGAYHGDTFATMAVCDPHEGMHKRFAGLLAQNIVADLPRDAESAAQFAALVKRHAKELAAIIVEPLVQGAGGMIFHAPEVLAAIRAAADRHDILLIFDEVFTGFGRTGAMFACAEAGVLPDIVCLSKALTGGTMALAATVARRHVFEAFWSDDPDQALMHGPTYMANALACAAANASLDLFEAEPRLGQVAAIEAGLKAGLEPCRALHNVKDVRVKGAIGVVELEAIADLDAMRRRFTELGVFVRPFGRIVYLTPAFTIEAEDLKLLTGAVLNVSAGRKG